jgi:hypothetical protein
MAGLLFREARVCPKRPPPLILLVIPLSCFTGTPLVLMWLLNEPKRRCLPIYTTRKHLLERIDFDDDINKIFKFRT